ncbi:hypothetical protein J6590_003342 [Homalodisca vitripennis]|nr:hypothetical protein J6590_003342 [Homalodisca vitripennis]
MPTYARGMCIREETCGLPCLTRGFTALELTRLESGAITDLTSGIWSLVRLKRSKNSAMKKLKINSLHRFVIRDT